MKTHLACLLALTSCAGLDPSPLESRSMPQHATPEFERRIDDTERFIFLSVLEGLYADGLQDDEVDRLLLRPESQEGYTHFVYGCPVCMWSIRALEAYRQRPERFYGIKNGASNFGPGLAPELRRKLLGDDVRGRLEVLNLLVDRWISERMTALNLSPEARERLRQELEKKRKQGRDMLERYRQEGWLPQGAPAYDGGPAECAACNGALGKRLPSPQDPPRPLH